MARQNHYAYSVSHTGGGWRHYSFPLNTNGNDALATALMRSFTLPDGQPCNHAFQVDHEKHSIQIITDNDLVQTEIDEYAGFYQEWLNMLMERYESVVKYYEIYKQMGGLK